MEMINERPICHRAEDLVTYLYGESTAEEARDFGTHLKQCDACRREFNLFNQVHESIVNWRSEVLGPMTVPSAVASSVADSVAPSRSWQPESRRLSAFAALRQFFAVSPLWLQGAAALATVALCALVVFTAMRLSRKPAPAVNGTNEAKYSQKDFDQAVKKQVDEKLAQIKQSEPSGPLAVSEPNIKKSRPQVAANRIRANNQRTKLSPQEREQLAADLGLISGREEELPFVLPDQPNP
jgi:hypothetical protein